jgi:ABC-type branched-subunit amino acid transport system ATPase component
MTPALELTGVSVSFGALVALRDVDLAVEATTVTGLIGPNGAGKTTLLDVVSGFVPPTRGEVALAGRRLGSVRAHRRAALGLGRTFQAVELFDDMSIAENLVVAADSAGADADATRSAAQVVGLRPDDGRLAGRLSHGERKRLALARALVGRPRVLLLDEPAAGLDLAERQTLVAVVRDVAAAGAAVLLVDHDLGLVLQACDRVVVLDLGAVIADGTPEEIRTDPAVAAAYVGPVGTSARRAAPAAATPTLAPTVQPQPPALSVRDLSAGYGDATVVEGVDLQVEAGEIVALLGPNGAGKTTTLLAVSGALPRSAGTVEVLGLPRRPGAHRQARRGVAHVLADRRVFAGLTAADNLRLARASDDALAEVLDLLPALRPRLGQRAGALSGGEQQMLALARALVMRPRLLVVDELSLGLAPRVVRELLDTLASMSRERGTAILLAEQHAELALSVAQRAYVIVAGRIVATAPAEQLAADPQRLADAYLGDAGDAAGLGGSHAARSGPAGPRPLVPAADQTGPLSRDEDVQDGNRGRAGRRRFGGRGMRRRRG